MDSLPPLLSAVLSYVDKKVPKELVERLPPAIDHFKTLRCATAIKNPSHNALPEVHQNVSVLLGKKKPTCIANSASTGRFFYYNVAAMTALMVCIRFSASSKTMEASLSKTSSVTSMQEMPNLS